MSKHWYAVHTYAGQEEKIKQNLERRIGALGLQDRIAHVLVPTEDETKLRGTKKVVVKRKVFPGYVLVEMEMDDETWHFIRQTVGVTGFLGQVNGNSRPMPLQETEVASWIGGTVDGEAATRKQTKLFHKGERVNIIGGPFSGSEGRIEDINLKSEKLTVMIPIFGRETRVDLDFSLVERIS